MILQGYLSSSDLLSEPRQFFDHYLVLEHVRENSFKGWLDIAKHKVRIGVGQNKAGHVITICPESAIGAALKKHYHLEVGI
jgi:hypothetical protein